MTAPVCHVPASSPIQQPSAVNLPSIPTPPMTFDWNALRNMLMAMKRHMELTSGQQGLSSNNKGNSNKNPNNQKKPNKPGSTGRYNEIDRATSKHRITNPQDTQQYVDVERIDKLTFQDTVTGEQWVWSRGG